MEFMSLFDPERLYLRRHAPLAYADQTRASAREMRDPRSRAQMLHFAMSNEDMLEPRLVARIDTAATASVHPLNESQGRQKFSGAECVGRRVFAHSPDGFELRVGRR